MRQAGKTWVKIKGGVPEIVGVIAEVDSKLDGDTAELAGNFPKSREGLEQILKYVVENVKYQRDGAEREMVKFPARTLRDGVGDCKSMSVLIGSILKDKAIPYKYRFTYTDENNPLAWHVYPIATLGGKQYYMDAVVKQFNKQHPYVAKYDYTPKEIVAVSGIGATAQPVPAPNFVDPYLMSPGEVAALLTYEQVNIINSQQPSQELQRAKETLKDALFLGVNDTAGRQEIERLELQGPRSFILRNIRKGRMPAGRKRARIGEPLIPVPDCSALADEQIRADIQEYMSEGNYDVNYIRQLEDQRAGLIADCRDKNRWKFMLNEHLEGSAHHLLYEYMENPNRQPATVATKTVLHRGAVDTLAGIVKVDRDILKLWLRNGVLRRNANKGAGALQPEESIPALQQMANMKEAQGVGLAVPVVVAIISAISTAVAGTLALIAQLKAEERARLQSAAATIGQRNFGPLWQDYATGEEIINQGGGPGENDNTLALAAAAAGAYFLLT